MVAISLYRGDLHRVPDVPRQWLMPVHPLSLKNFKSLLSRRSKSLALLRATATSNTNPNQQEQQGSIKKECNEIDRLDDSAKGEDVVDEDAVVKDEEEVKELEGDDDHDQKRVCGSDSVPVVANTVAKSVEGNENLVATTENVAAETQNPNPEASDKENTLNEKEKRIKEVEDKLKVLNERKHSLVQVLKQILNVEEELKRRNSVQALATRPSVSLQVDVTNDSALMNRSNSPRVGSEANLSGDVEGGEADDISNPNVNSRRPFRMSSTSPSSVSPMRRPMHVQHNAVSPHPTRSPLGTSSSPSRFAPMALQGGHPGTIPSVSVSGTSYIPSSPSPAASGGTSVFREIRHHPSPWN